MLGTVRMIELDPQTWLLDVIREQPGVRSVEHSRTSILMVTEAGQRYTVSIHRPGNYDGP